VFTVDVTNTVTVGSNTTTIAVSGGIDDKQCNSADYFVRRRGQYHHQRYRYRCRQRHELVGCGAGIGWKQHRHHLCTELRLAAGHEQLHGDSESERVSSMSPAPQTAAPRIQTT